MIISKINTEIETFCMDSDFRQSYPLESFFGEGGTIWILNRVFSCPFFVFQARLKQ